MQYLYNIFAFVAYLFMHIKRKIKSPSKNVDTISIKHYEFSLNDAILTYFFPSERKKFSFSLTHTFIGWSTQPDQNISVKYLITSISLSCRWLALTAMYIIYKEDL